MGKNATSRTTEFNGLNNMVDKVTLGLDSFTVADNIDITNKQKVVRAKGYISAYTGTSVVGGYSTKDFSRLYVIDNGSLLQMNTDLTVMRTLRTGLSTNPYYFDEVNGVVFYSNGIDFGLITPNGAKPWGIPAPNSPTATVQNGGSLLPGVYQIVCTLVDHDGLESSNSDVFVAQVQTSGGRIFITSVPQVAGYTTNIYATKRDGNVLMLLRENCGIDTTYDENDTLYGELPFWNTNTPRGTQVAYWMGRMYTMEYYPSQDMTAVWSSLPLHFHHFDPGSEGFTVPGKGAFIRGIDGGVIVGTDREIHLWDGEKIRPLAGYGAVPGWHATEFQGKMYFWTLRGLCRAMPFENLHESTVSVPPGLSAGAAVVEKDGTRRYVVALQKGGVAFNPKS